MYLNKCYQMLKHPKSSSLVFYKHPNALKLNITLLTTSNEYLLLYLTKCYQMLKHPKSSSVKFHKYPSALKMYITLLTTCDKYLLLFMTKSKTIFKTFQIVVSNDL